MLDQGWTWAGRAWLWLTGPAGGISNLVTLIGGLASAWALSYGWFRRRLRHNGAVIARLESDLSRRTDQCDRCNKQIEEIKALRDALTARLPETTVAVTRREMRDGNDFRAHDAAQEWLQSEGKTIADLLYIEAEWAATHAVGDAHLAGFTVAQAYATAACVFWPARRDAAALAMELRGFLDNATDQHIPLRQALDILADVEPGQFLGAAAVDFALDCERRALVALENNQFRIAWVLASQAAEILKCQVGRSTEVTIRAILTRAELSIWVGETHLVLADVEQVVAIMTQRLDPHHPQRLEARSLLAKMLNRLGRAAEALPIIQDVVAKQEANPDARPLHSDALGSRWVLGQVLDSLGRWAEALPIIQDIVAKHDADADIGPQHPESLTSRASLAQVLDLFGRSAEALAIIQDVVTKQEADSTIGPQHPNALLSRLQLARVLDNLGRSAEALSIVQAAVAKQDASPDLGPLHPLTLFGRSLLARVLNNLGRSAEALPISQDTIANQNASPVVGPQHPETLTSRFVLAQILEHLGRLDEALSIIQDVVAKQGGSPDLGPANHKTLRSRSLLAQVLDSLGRPVEALHIIENVMSTQEGSPNIGPLHQDTLTSRRRLGEVLHHLDRNDEAWAMVEDLETRWAGTPGIDRDHAERRNAIALSEKLKARRGSLPAGLR